MERTYERRRSAVSAGAGRGKRQAVDPRERRRLIQLGVSAGLFLLVFIGRGLLGTEQISAWKERLGHNTDFKGAFSQLGTALSRGDPLAEALGELWVEVFAGGAVPAAAPVSGTENLPSFSQLLAQQLACPGDPVSRRQAEAAKLWAAKQAQGAAASFSTAAGGGAPAAQILALRPLAATAQAADAQGRPLPERVSLEQYDLGLGRLLLPVSAPLTSGFGFREGPVAGGEDFHLGVDLGAAEGTKIVACADGVVVFAGENRTYGDYVKIDHGKGVTTLYAHCQKLLVKQGQRVAAGESIARVGHTGDATGAHLHFSVLKNDIFLDPLYYIAPPT